MGRTTSRHALGCAVALLATCAVAGCAADGRKAADAPRVDVTSSLADCATRFNDEAPDGFARIIRLVHADDRPLLVGRLVGPGFTAQTFDTELSGDGTEATVREGACVVTERLRTSPGAVYVFALADDGQWHRFLESDPAVPLSTDPASQLEDVSELDISDADPPEVPELVPAPE